MGIYQRSISKRTKTIDGMVVALSNFYGKAPSFFSDSNRSWNTFCTKAHNTANEMHGKVHYILMDNEMYDGVSVAKWNGRDIMDDYYWEKNIIGSFIKIGRKYHFKPNNL